MLIFQALSTSWANLILKLAMLLSFKIGLKVSFQNAENSKLVSKISIIWTVFYVIRSSSLSSYDYLFSWSRLPLHYMQSVHALPLVSSPLEVLTEAWPQSSGLSSLFLYFGRGVAYKWWVEPSFGTNKS